MTKREYDYVFGQYGVADGSPSFFWEGERTEDLGAISQFTGIDALLNGSCNQ